MKRFFLVVLCVVLGCVVADAKRKPLANKDDCFGRTCIDVKGKSGQIAVYHGSKKGKEVDSLRMKFDDILEVDSNGKPVGKGGPKEGKHSFKTFANLQFEFSDLYNTTVNGMKAIGYNFSANIPGPNATLEVEILFLKGMGTMDICGDENVEVKGNRSMKFNINIKNWNFCGGKGGDSCNKDEEGKYIDFLLAIESPQGKMVRKGRKPPKKQSGKKRKPKQDWFGKMKMSLPQSIELDGSCGLMPDDYPKVEPRGKMNIITFRFPRFTGNMKYDPVVDTDADEPSADDLEPTDSAASSLYSTLLLPALLLMHMLW